MFSFNRYGNSTLSAKDTTHIRTAYSPQVTEGARIVLRYLVQPRQTRMTEGIKWYNEKRHDKLILYVTTQHIQYLVSFFVLSPHAITKLEFGPIINHYGKLLRTRLRYRYTFQPATTVATQM